jgi:hypothetical protein
MEVFNKYVSDSVRNEWINSIEETRYYVILLPTLTGFWMNIFK